MEKLNKFIDERGILVPFELEKLSFLPKRFFYVYNVPVGTWRGGHAHYETEQFLICVQGKIAVKLESKNGIEEFVLEEGETCYIEKLVWDSQNFLEEDSVLLVLCSTNYNKSDYIFDKSLIL